MEGPFLSTPAKRPFHLLSSAGAGENPDPINGDSTASKRRFSSKPPPPPIHLSPNQTSFRLLCPAAKTGGVIGKSGSIVKLFQQETGAKIRIQDSVAACDERVILIVAPDKKKSENDGAGKLGEGVSPAQEALVRVFDRILQADGEQEFPAGVACRLLAARNQVGCVLGKGGKIIQKIKKESGAKIRVLAPEQVPACASPNDEVIQIVGDISAVKKAIIAVSRCLQDNLPSDKVTVSASRPVEAVSQETYSSRIVGAVPHETFTDAHGELFSQRTSLLMSGNPNSSLSFGISNDYVSARGRAGAESIPALEQKKTQQDVAFRLLCSNDRVGGVIGKGGSIVRVIQSETGATISVGATVAESDERVITISALENPESRSSPAQNALVRVFTRSIEAAMEKGLELGQDKGAPVSARLLVPSNQIGCLLGKGGMVIAEMRRITGAGLRILGVDQVPKCASENDQLIQISGGDLGIVQDALVHVTGRLRDNLFPSKTINGAGAGIYSSTIPEVASYGRVREPTSPGPYRSLGLSHNLDHPSALSHSYDRSYLQAGDHPGLSHSFDRSSPSRLWSSQGLGGSNPRGITDIGKGLTPLGGLELGSGSKIAIVTNTTVEIVVPEHVISLVYGESGRNLSRIRKISGAKVVVHDPRPGTSEGVVIISGTPDQTQAAQSLLQAFILSGQASPDPHSRFL